MLPAANRMRRSSDFTTVLRYGRRAGTPTAVMHHHCGLRADGAASVGPRADDAASVGPRADDAPLVGLVVGRDVGNSVLRHRVSRRLRAELTRRLDLLPDGSGTVVRALPAAAPASSAELGRDLDRLLRRLVTGPDPAPRSGSGAEQPG